MVTFRLDNTDPVALAERIITILDSGHRNDTQACALLIALMDLSLEGAAGKTAQGQHFTTDQITRKIIELYWPHTRPCSGEVLKQGGPILKKLREFQEKRLGGYTPFFGRAPEGPWNTLVRAVEQTLIKDIIPRLQKIGGKQIPYLYSIAWNEKTDGLRVDAKRYQKGEAGYFDPRLWLKPLVPENLTRLNSLLRGEILRRWAATVADMNDDAVSIEEFLFGRDRVSTTPVQAALRELHDNKCFYCRRSLSDKAVVDPFLPWSRYPDNGIENLVIADPKCAESKGDLLAATGHVAEWVKRMDDDAPEAAELEGIADEMNWDRHPNRTRAVARAIYLRLPADKRLWLKKTELEKVDLDRLIELLGALPG